MALQNVDNLPFHNNKLHQKLSAHPGLSGVTTYFSKYWNLEFFDFRSFVDYALAMLQLFTLFTSNPPIQYASRRREWIYRHTLIVRLPPWRVTKFSIYLKTTPRRPKMDWRRTIISLCLQKSVRFLEVSILGLFLWLHSGGYTCWAERVEQIPHIERFHIYRSNIYHQLLSFQELSPNELPAKTTSYNE